MRWWNSFFFPHKWQHSICFMFVQIVQAINCKYLISIFLIGHSNSNIYFVYFIHIIDNTQEGNVTKIPFDWNRYRNIFDQIISRSPPNTEPQSFSCPNEQRIKNLSKNGICINLWFPNSAVLLFFPSFLAQPLTLTTGHIHRCNLFYFFLLIITYFNRCNGFSVRALNFSSWI